MPLNLRSLLGLKDRPYSRITEPGLGKYADTIPAGYYTEGQLCTIVCEKCKCNKIKIIRSSCYSEDGGRVVENLRFEQKIKGGVGLIVRTVALIRNHESQRPSKKWAMEWAMERAKLAGGTGMAKLSRERYIVVNKEMIEEVECIRCKGLTCVSHRIVEYEKEKGRYQWQLLTGREAKEDLIDEKWMHS